MSLLQIITFAYFLCSIEAGIIESHHHVVHEPVLTKIGTVIHSVPSSAVSHQSFTQIHSKSIETPIVAPGVKTTIHHTSPTVLHDVETVEQVQSADKKAESERIKSTESSASVSVKSAPIVHTVTSTSTNHNVVHSIPLIKTIIPSSSYTVIHH